MFQNKFLALKKTFSASRKHVSRHGSDRKMFQNMFFRVETRFGTSCQPRNMFQNIFLDQKLVLLGQNMFRSTFLDPKHVLEQIYWHETCSETWFSELKHVLEQVASLGKCFKTTFRLQTWFTKLEHVLEPILGFETCFPRMKVYNSQNRLLKNVLHVRNMFSDVKHVFHWIWKSLYQNWEQKARKWKRLVEGGNRTWNLIREMNKSFTITSSSTSLLYIMLCFCSSDSCELLGEDPRSAASMRNSMFLFNVDGNHEVIDEVSHPITWTKFDPSWAWDLKQTAFSFADGGYWRAICDALWTGILW